MKYQIDQSNKVEDTNKTTFVGLCNGEVTICSISASEKQELMLFFRELDKPLIFKLFTFSVLCAKVITKAKITSVTIDEEYTGHNREIKLFITQILKIHTVRGIQISFAKIGKSVPAHLRLHAAMKDKQKGTVIFAKDVLRYFDKISKQ